MHLSADLFHSYDACTKRKNLNGDQVKSTCVHQDVSKNERNVKPFELWKISNCEDERNDAFVFRKYHERLVFLKCAHELRTNP